MRHPHILAQCDVTPAATSRAARACTAGRAIIVDVRSLAFATVLPAALLIAPVAAARPAPPAFHIAYDAAHLDLDRHVLQFKPSRPVTGATLVVLGDGGAELGKGSATYSGAHQSGWLSITWTQPADTRAMVLKLRVVAADRAATNVQLIPWSVAIDHRDVNFSTDSAVIEPSEAPKLDASLAKIAGIVKRNARFMKMTLYIAGHTDTVGPAGKNRTLSMNRALSIGRYFRKKGLSIPIVVAGFGESVLKVKTPDNTDARANRRADYVLGPAGGAPPFRGAYLTAHAAWKRLK